MGFNEVLAIQLARERLTWKDPVRVVALGTVTRVGLQVVDDVALDEGDSVLLTADGANNGIWVASASTWKRRGDADKKHKLLAGTGVRALEGTTSGLSNWFLTTTGTIDIGVTFQTWQQEATGGGGGGGTSDLLPWKATARGVVTANASLSGALTFDGVTYANGERALVVAQSTASQNGIYTVNTAGAWSRVADADSSPEVIPNLMVWVAEGTLNADTVWVCITNAPIVLGSTALSFVKSAAVPDKIKLDASTSNATASTLVQRDSTAGANFAKVGSAFSAAGGGTERNAITATLTASSGTDSTQDSYAVRGEYIVSGTTTSNGIISGMSGWAVHNSTNPGGTYAGLWGCTEIRGSGTAGSIDIALGLASYIGFNGPTSGFIGEVVGYQMDPPGGCTATCVVDVFKNIQIRANGVLTPGINHHYGIYAEDVSVMTPDSWFMYSNGGDSAHVGGLILGDTTRPNLKLEITGDTFTSGIRMTDGQDVPVSNANEGVITYDAALQKWVSSENGGAFAPFGGGGGGGFTTAGTGLTSSGTTVNVIAHADGSIVANADSIQVGVINDTQHGTRGGGTLHAAATQSVAGFLSAADKTKLDAATDAATPTTLALRDASGNASFATAKVSTALDTVGAVDLTLKRNAVTREILTSTGIDTKDVTGVTIRTDALPNAGTVTETWTDTVTAITITQSQDPSGSGATFAIKAQQGAAGSSGGKLQLWSGLPGTAGTVRSGDIEIGLGPNETAANTASFKFMKDATNSTVFLSILDSGSTTETLLTSPQATRLQATGAFTFTSFQTSAQYLWKSSAGTIRTDTMQSAGAATLQYGAGVTSIVENQAQAASGTGATRTINAQKGAAAAAGGKLQLAGGLPGTSGTLASGNTEIGLGPNTTGGSTAYLSLMKDSSNSTQFLRFSDSGTDAHFESVGIGMRFDADGQLTYVSNQSTPLFVFRGQSNVLLRTETLPPGGACTVVYAEAPTSIKYTQAARTGNDLPSSFTIESQGPYASATGANLIAGDVILSVPAAASGAASEGTVKVRIAATDVAKFAQPYVGGARGGGYYNALQFPNTTDALINALDQTAASTLGASITVRAGHSTGVTSSGGNMTLLAGNGTQDGGALELGGGNGITNGNGGVLYLHGGVKAGSGVSSGICLHDTASLGGGEKIVFVGNRTTAPTSNPAGGSFLYAESGALKARGSSGTVTTIAPADPHCPTCGRDFALEWQNEGNGEHMAVCMPCLVGAIAGAGIDASKFMITDKLKR